MRTLIIDGHEASLSQQEFAEFHGNSVFTTMLAKGFELFLWHRHWRRICDHAEVFGYKIPDEREVYGVIKKQLKANSFQKIRVIVYENKYAITCEPYSLPDPANYSGASVIVSTYKVHPQFSRYKTANSLPYVLAQKEAYASSAFEALLTNHDNFIVDGSRTSIMMFQDQTLFSLEGGLLGCMREEVLDYAMMHGVKIKREYLRWQELSGQLLLANSLLGVVPVGAIKFDFVAKLVEHFRPSKILSFRA